jgi:hypothetical protein
MDRRARVSAPRRSLHAVVTIAVAAAVAVVLPFILVVVPLLNAASEIPDGPVHAYADYRDGVRHQFQQAQQDGGSDERPGS